MYRHRFGFTGDPLPKGAQGRTFFEKGAGYVRLARAFRQLTEEPGLGVLTGDAGVGKTAALRNLCAALPRPDYQVLYLCDTAVSPLDLYRTLAQELGVRVSHRRAQLWCDLKQALVHLVEERHTLAVVVLDEAQHLSDRFLADLSGFLNFAFDSRDLLTLWLVGLPPLARRLRMQQHAPLQMRVSAQVHAEPCDRETLLAMVDHGLKAAGATTNLLSDPARDLLVRTSRGVPRVAARLLRTALRLADERDQTFIDEQVMAQALDELAPPATVPA
jgi:MSHA biogenesis protein MshM